MARNEELYNAVAAGKRRDVQRIVQECLDREGDALELLNESMIPAMQEVGEKFSRGEAFIPEMLVAARAMQAGVNLIEPILVKSGHKATGKVCIGAVKGDLHDIGKNLVAIMLRSAGYEVIDLGTDCDVDKFREAVEKQGAQAVLASALLSTTMSYMEKLVEGFRDRPDIPVIIGGAPVTEEFAEQIGAAGYGKDAGAAVHAVRRLVPASA